MNYIIVFKDGSNTTITEDQHNVINSPQATSAGAAIIGGTRIDLKWIARTCTEEQFYQEYPDKRPLHVQDNSALQISAPKNRYTREENIERMRQAAYESKKKEQEKYGITKHSSPLSEWELSTKQLLTK